jgi:diguanylate cyclase (GGDEF)-like protein
MKRRRNAVRIGTLLLLTLGLILHFVGGSAADSGVPAVFASAIALIFCSLIAGSIKEPPPPPRKRTTEISLPRVLQQQASDEAEPSKTTNALGKTHRKLAWAETEALADTVLDTAMNIVSKHTHAYTVAVFFPTNDGGYMLRRYKSDSQNINTGAILYPGVGVIGSFLKDGIKKLNLREIMNDSVTLYYYTQNVGIRSLITSPIIAGGNERGVLLADSRNPNNFNDDDHLLLENVASLLGQAVYSSYLYTEHRLQHERLSAMSSIEKEFFQDLSRASILEKITQIVPFALPCDRLTISMKNEDGVSATLVSAVGNDADMFTGATFSLTEKSLASILYTKNLVLSRNFSKEHDELRYFQNEPRDESLQSFVAVPLGVDQCLGMLLVESRRENAFDDSNKELLGRLSTSAGLAVEKLLIFEKANTLATHDGLTGLYNHRTFQQLLADEITRAIRYTEPVSMVICDIDHFKRVNDSYGHPFGDVVLKGVSATLQNSVRQDIDTVARYGGEEFAIILVKTDATGAAETAERIRLAIAAVPFKAPGGKDVSVTMSFGIAEFKKDARQVNDLIAKADKALYRAKENGRNRVEIF